MGADALASLVSAMLNYLQSAGYSRQQLAVMTDLPKLPACDGNDALSATQLQHLWLLIQKQLCASLDMSLRVRPLIQAQLEKGRVRVEQVAAQLNMSRYTLYKRLKEENLTFAAILEDVRREQALVYLGDQRRPLTEVAERLGFSELSAFSRAFKRWMGCSPAEYRAAPSSD